MSLSFDAILPKRVVEGIINVPPILSGELAEIIDLEVIKKWIGSITHFSESRFVLELVAADLDLPYKEKETETVKAYSTYIGFDDENKMFTYKCEFEVPDDFGEIGAVLVENEHHRERYIKNIVLNDINVIFSCESWIHSKNDNPDKRIFFTNKSYLPSETPTGLMSLREKDLESLRGNGEGQRKPIERIYDYDTYNDLGDPDTSSNLSRPVLGGEKQPYPRRCRTGRPMTTTEPWSESRKNVNFYDQFYVPRDEAFSDRKVAAFGTMQILISIVQALKKSLTEFEDMNEFSSSLEENIKQDPSYIETALKWLFDKWVDWNHLEDVLKVVVPRFFEDLYGTVKTIARLEYTRATDKISFSWLRDEEFCRQTIAGINPYSIQLVTEWPLMSKLDPEVYGPAESAITKEIVEIEINKQGFQGFVTLEEALEKKKLFMLDYHDLLLPYVNEVRELEGTTLYGSRTLMFLTANETLKPVAIELTRPPTNGKPQWNRVYIPNSDETSIDSWLWNLAKAHVLAHDSGYHQLISHWLRTHCVMEPYIIATHRCLSKMNPIYRLLFPHLRYTMQINSLARTILINGGGIVEFTFFSSKYSMKLSSDVYAQEWRFDHEALPVDLIRRGMAVEDISAPHGLKLAITDFPFANDGLILWDAIKQWASTYVKHYYPQSDLVVSDEELQAWWTEIKTEGHKDKKEGWPELKTQQDLIDIVTTIMWVASGHHSAVNFGQYTGAYSPPSPYPPRPTTTRTNMPDEDPTNPDWETEFLKNPTHELGKCFPTIEQANKVQSTFDVLSSHSPDEEYIGIKMEASWESEPVINQAFGVFKKSLEDLEHTIDVWNSDPKMINRKGKGKVPYELFKQKSEAGVTGKGVPYSVSI